MDQPDIPAAMLHEHHYMMPPGGGHSRRGYGPGEPIDPLSGAVQRLYDASKQIQRGSAATERMRTSLWPSPNDRSSIIAGNMHIMPMMPGMVVSMMNAVMMALMMVMPSLCGRDRERKSEDRE